MDIEITPASMAQVARGRGGRFVTIEQDLLDVAKQIKEVHPEFKLQWSEDGEYFRVIQDRGPDYRPHTVTTSEQADQRLVNRLRFIVHNPSRALDAAEAAEAAVTAGIDATFTERVGEASERLAHAVRTELRRGRPGPVYMPPDAYSVTKHQMSKKGTK